MASWASVFTFASLFLVLPAFLIFLGIRAFSAKERDHDAVIGGGLGAPAFALTGLIAGVLVAAVTFELIGRAISDDVLLSAVPPPVLILVLVAASRVPERQTNSFFYWALAATVGVGMYFVVSTLIRENDGTALWGIGILYSWIGCGIPLFLAAGLLSFFQGKAR